MAKKDYYAILGVEKTATDEQIKSAYRQKAKQYHPDLHPNDAECAEKFKECNEAYEILGNAENRRKYDSGEMDFDGFQFSQDMHGFGDIFDFFGSFMGGGARGRTASQVGSDVTQTVNLTFMEAIKGVKKEIDFVRYEKCSDCNGSGAHSSEDIKTCDKCNGTGRIQMAVNTLFGRQMTVTTCDKCNGTGKIISKPCKTCGGSGLMKKRKKLSITIPAGVDNGAMLSVNGQGNASKYPSGTAGNLILVMNVASSPVFKRDDLHLYTEVPISYYTAVAGGEIEIPTPDGIEIQRLKEGTKNGEVFRLRGKGIKNSHRSGDLVVKVVVEVPRSVDKKEKTALENFEKGLNLKNYPNRKEYLENIHKMFS